MGSDNMRLAVALNGYGLPRPDGRLEVLPWSDVVEQVLTAEQTRYEAVFTPEIGAREAFSSLAGFAARTERITLATGVVPIASRDVRRTAMAAATLNDVSGGRFVLGLGSNETLEATRAYVRGVRSLLAGQGPPASADVAPLDLVPEERVPIFLAALGPRMTELAGEVGDGAILNWCTPERVARAREEIVRGAERARRDPRGSVVAVFVRACLGHDEEHAVAALREAASRYAAMPKYARQLEAMGLADAPLESIVEAVTVRGERDAALERLGAYADAGADLVVVYPVPAQDAGSSIMGTLLALAPRPAVES